MKGKNPNWANLEGVQCILINILSIEVSYLQKKNVDIVELLQNEYNRNWKLILTTLVNGFFGFQIILILFIYMRDFGLVVLSD
jgi:hypothetical protein